MAAGTSEGSRVQYYQIFQGKVVRRIKGPAEGSKVRVNKNNVEVHEMHYDFLEGHITKIETIVGNAEKKIPDQLMIQMEDSGDVMQLTTPLDSSYSLNLLNRLCACDLNLTTKLTPYDFQADGRDIRGVNVEQAGMAVKPPMNKDTPGMPTWERIELPNGVVWNKLAQIKFLLQVLQKVCRKNGTLILTVLPKYTVDGNGIVPSGSPSNQSAPPPAATQRAPMEQTAPGPVSHERTTPHLPPKAPADFDAPFYPSEDDDDLPF